MIRSLFIKNFILIEEFSIEFESGFYAIIGETGAGKSIILDAMMFCLGYKFDDKVIKHDASYCTVAIDLDITDGICSILSANAISIDGDNIIIKAHQERSGRKKFTINNEPVTQKLVSQLAAEVIEIHGQGAHNALGSKSSHIQILDIFGHLTQLQREVEGIFKEKQLLLKRMHELHNEQHSITQEIDYLQFSINEIESMQIIEGEEEELAIKRSTIQAYEKESKSIYSILNILTNHNTSQQIIAAQKIIYKQAKANLTEVASDLENASTFLDSAICKLEHMLSDIDLENIEFIEERLFAIRAIARKHNISVNDISQYLLDIKDKLASLKCKINSLSHLESQLLEISQIFKEKATVLSHMRKKAAKLLEQRVLRELEPLKMHHASLHIEFNDRDVENATANGIDDVKFMVITNPGLPPAAIDKIASGGELSRFMLAFKIAILDQFNKSTMIFDEIDTGISGIVADAIGERLRSIGRATQIIAITHQPQVAAKADYHIHVMKDVHDSSTISKAQILSKCDATREIARMLSGQNITESAMLAAKELLNTSSDI